MPPTAKAVRPAKYVPPQPVQYDDGGTTKTYKPVDPTKAITFWSEHISLKVILKVTYNGSEDFRQESVPVQFSDRRYTTDETAIIESLRQHGSYGGSFDKNFTNNTINGGQPLFWEGSLPAETTKKIKERESTFTTEEFSYEPDKDRSQRYSDQD